MHGFDPEVINDFLTESGELLEELDADLVSLEDASNDPELLNKVFRALHTIKGSASFLALTNLVEIAHVAEDALNVARKGEAAIDRSFMDLLLEAVDVLKQQFEQLESGEDLAKAPDELVAGLSAITSGGGAPADDAGAETPAEAGSPAGKEPATSDDPHADRPLELPENKDILLEFMVDDLDATLEQMRESLAESAFDAERVATLVDAAEGLARTAEFFDVDTMVRLVAAIAGFAEAAEHMDETALAAALPRVRAAHWLLTELAPALRERTVRSWPVEGFLERLTALVESGEAPEIAVAPDAKPKAVLEAEGVLPGGKTDPAPAPALADAPAQAIEPEAAPEPEPQPESTPAPAAAQASDAQPAEAPPSGDQPKSAPKPKVEQTIRVEVGRLESLLNLVGELVLQKNRVTALSRQIAVADQLDVDLIEAVGQSSSDLDRVTGDIQVAVMRTRLQPLDKIFGKYPRLIRDLARKTGKNIRLVIEGGDTEVDKSVIEELGDPLVHLLRNSADHGIEDPETRAASGKAEMGTITLSAAHEGSHVLIQIRDDGKGLDRDRIANKALDKGLITQDELAAMSDREVYRFIFAAGLSTADKVSDLSGRGVGMDVVRSNIENLKGHIDVDSTPGEGTVLSIRIPLTVAIMPAMMVGVGRELYAVPLSAIVEIVRPTPEQMSTINGRQVMRLRDSVLPLVRVSELFDVAETDPALERFAVVVEHNEQCAGLIVTELIGQQEIVVKPLDEELSGESAVSGATVRDDGGVSLIVDVERMIAAVQHLAAVAA
jgi:two-component system chemotaxis sensor kinase CheA